MTATLTDRYVHATVRSVPEERRDEIGRELRASIEDMIEPRLDAGEPRDAAERAVLGELGDPDRLASEYSRRSLVLIGPRYFLTWQRLLTRLLLIVPALVGALVVVGKLIADDPGGEVVGHAVMATFQTALQVAFWTTLVFAVMERTGAEVGEWSVDSLPEVPEHDDARSADVVGSIVFIALIGVVLVAQQFRSFVEGPDGDDVPVLDPDLWSFWLPVVLVGLAIEIGAWVLLWRAGRWTVPIAAVYTVGGLLSTVPLVVLSLREDLLDPAFVRTVDIGADALDAIYLGIAVVAVVTFLWELVSTWLKVRRARV